MTASKSVLVNVGVDVVTLIGKKVLSRNAECEDWLECVLLDVDVGSYTMYSVRYPSGSVRTCAYIMALPESCGIVNVYRDDSVDIGSLRTVWVRDYDDLPWREFKLLVKLDGKAYPFVCLSNDREVVLFKQMSLVKPSFVEMREMTDVECIDLVGRWVFRDAVSGNIRTDWCSRRCVQNWKGCPISELVEPIDKSPWRKLEVEV